MAWNEIENLKPISGFDALSPKGVQVSARKMGSRKEGGGTTRYIRIRIGKDLAKAISMVGDHTALRLLLGSGAEAGQIGLTADLQRGKFRAKRAKDGSYALTINAASAEGRFALEFAPFAVLDVQVVRPPNLAPIAMFAASAEMLAAG